MCLQLCLGSVPLCPFLSTTGGFKLNALSYEKHLKTELFPAAKEVCPRNEWMHAQDGVNSHTANITQKFLSDTIGGLFN